MTNNQWRLMKALFLLGLSWALFLFGYILGGAMFQNIPSILLLYGSLACAGLGIVKGISALIDRNHE